MFLPRSYTMFHKGDMDFLGLYYYIGPYFCPEFPYCLRWRRAFHFPWVLMLWTPNNHQPKPVLWPSPHVCITVLAILYYADNHRMLVSLSLYPICSLRTENVSYSSLYTQSLAHTLCLGHKISHKWIVSCLKEKMASDVSKIHRYPKHLINMQKYLKLAA